MQSRLTFIYTVMAVTLFVDIDDWIGRRSRRISGKNLCIVNTSVALMRPPQPRPWSHRSR